ncbi:MAG: hypothetical protein HKN55_02915 [Woeseiaceae bacterium]|nr:hypothetical protein [Woeseiaceae bacterium]
MFAAKQLRQWVLRASAVYFVSAALMACAASQAVDETHNYGVLLIGNSHSSRGGLPDMLETLLEADGGNKSAYVKAVGHWAFLAERLNDDVTQKALDSRRWTHVILQAQKYSTSGRYSYPTDAAGEWIRRVRERGAQPILFPEWARREHPEEFLRIQRLHLKIASRDLALVAPVGLAWELMRDTHPDIVLHASDGNHANRQGALLTAYVLYSSMTGQSPAELPYTEMRGIPEDTQAVLRSAASKAIRAMGTED